jgi:hypothetical protein
MSYLEVGGIRQGSEDRRQRAEVSRQEAAGSRGWRLEERCALGWRQEELGTRHYALGTEERDRMSEVREQEAPGTKNAQKRCLRLCSWVKGLKREKQGES